MTIVIIVATKRYLDRAWHEKQQGLIGLVPKVLPPLPRHRNTGCHYIYM